MIARIGKRLKRRRPASEQHSSFRNRYIASERRREQMLARLNGLNAQARNHPGYRRALTLLNEQFRKGSVSQRLTILQAAEWLIDLIETMSFIA